MVEQFAHIFSRLEFCTIVQILYNLHICTVFDILHNFHNLAHFAQFGTFCTIWHILHKFAYFASNLSGSVDCSFVSVQDLLQSIRFTAG